MAQSKAKSDKRLRAVAKVAVRHSTTRSYDVTEDSALVEVQLCETFTGDMKGESLVRALKIAQYDLSASLVSMQRFRGTLGGLHGSFVLQGEETVDAGKIKATWFVVAGSGTDELSGLRGVGGFEGTFGKGSDATLDYWFEHP